jgi:DNA-3-methyladenine glycosylase
MPDTLKPLPRSFFARDTHVVARTLLGKLLVRQWRGKIVTARISEVESYVGEDDAASHARAGKTARTALMYGAAGHAYVYLIYGMYHCLNVVTDKKDFPAAVLIRGAGDYTGPGKLCRALHITRALNGEDLVTSQRLWIADDGWRPQRTAINATPRIGVDYAGEHALLPWRYILTQSA